ncbi:MAG TPA: PfkB family carbohydrate kinase [Bryobacteraceae bacterium]|nr:PfkB family carbohydrate kinase [Bryobacteraceae bacterium]
MSGTVSAGGAIDVLGIGLNATDTVILVDAFPPYAGKVAFQEEFLSPGGQVASAMVACARLGLRTKYIGTIGDDHRGKIQRDSLAGTGVDASGLIVREGCPNQTAYIIVDQRTGERTVLWQRADCLRLKPEEVNLEDIAAARMLHIDGYDVEAAARASACARQKGVPVSLDVDTVYPDFERVLQNVDYLVASHNWTREWTRESDPFVGLSRLAREYNFAVSAMTLGEDGSLAYRNGEWFYSPAFELDCVDTTGAGDVFHGAFCYAMLANMPMQEVLEFSNAAAGLNCTAFGARGHVPVLSEVNALLASYADGRVKRRRGGAYAELQLAELHFAELKQRAQYGTEPA